MKVSVIIPTFNCARFIGEAIESVLTQTYLASEIIVVDDGSTDGTVEILRPYADRITYVYRRNAGVAAARSTGLRRCQGDLIAFLDSDDVWHPRSFEFQVDFLRRRPEISLLGTRTVDWPNKLFAEIAAAGSVPASVAPFAALAIKNMFVTSSMIVRKEVVEQVGEFDRSLRGPEDYDFWIWFWQLTQTANLELPLTGYRQVPGSLGKQAVTMEAGMLRILEKMTESGNWDGNRLLRRKAYAYTLFSCSIMYAAAGRQRSALIRLLRSLACYPWLFRRDQVRIALARPRLLAVTLLRLLGLKRGTP